MKRTQILIAVLFPTLFLFGQPTPGNRETSWKNIYEGTATRINDLVHTRLEVRFDFDKSYLYGKEWVTLQPHFYPTDSLTLDAKGMDIHKIALVKGTNMQALKYDYDGLVLRIQLGKTFKGSERYTLFIDYTSKPDELKVTGSKAITNAKGLYFINPKGVKKNEPTQIWTQGETESNSVWFPTIDKPNQKTTEEIYMTVPNKYVTLSNGKPSGQKENGDGTRTDYWKMDLPNAPYLFFMGVGDYAIVKDSYKGKEVAYYVEKPYAPVARKIFGNTPEMIAFFSSVTGVEFPWVKYDQIVGREYVSGAMENTTCTLHHENAQQDARELVDGNNWEDIIAHELFHQWFGDLVTTESWSNITLNESFADFSETLWNEHKYGKDAGDAVNYKGMQIYLADSANASKDLVRFYYANREDVFDMVNYSKGGRILNMLRNYVGDSAFFKSLNLYLNENKFKSAEAQELRLAFEEVTGQDLNWFWNQWYYGHGHPKLTIDYLYNENAKTVSVIINQTQDGDRAFTIPLAIDIYNGSQKYRHSVWIEHKTDTFTFAYNQKPDLVNVDGDKMLLCEKTDHKTLDNFIHQYKYAGLYADRREAIEYCADYQEDPKALALLKSAVQDRFYGLRDYTLEKLDLKKDNVKQAMEPLLAEIAQKDANSIVRAQAIELLGQYKKTAYKSIFEKAMTDSSYSVAGSGLNALFEIDKDAAIAEAHRISAQPMKGKLSSAVANALIETQDLRNFDLVSNNFDKTKDLQDKLDLVPGFAGLLIKTRDLEQFKKGVDLIIKFRDDFPGRQHDEIATDINNNILKILQQIKESTGPKEQADYIRSKLAVEKKGF